MVRTITAETELDRISSREGIMEHRWHKRDPIKADVMLYHHGVPIARCSVHNVSNSGLFIQPSDKQIPINAPVEVEFMVAERFERKRIRLPARVIHQESGGVGLMFQPATQATSTVLRSLFSR